MIDFAGLLSKLSPIEVVDVGALTLGAGTEPYAKLMEQTRVRVTGFEPVKEECDTLNAMGRAGHRYFPYALADGTLRKFYLCNYPMTSSLYEPNTELLKLFNNIANLTTVVKVLEMQTHRLDDIKEITDVDYLKVDVQGAELDVMRGGEAALAKAVLVHTEVEFVELYKGQPLIGEVDAYMRQKGFCFHKFMGISGRTFSPLVINNDVNAAMSQAMWGEAVYVRDFMALEKLPAEKLIKLAAILHIQYGSMDLAAHCLAAVDKKLGGKLGEEYRRGIMTPAPVAASKPSFVVGKSRA